MGTVVPIVSLRPIHSVSSALLVCVRSHIRVVHTGSIGLPEANAIHRLRTAALRPLLEVVSKRATVSVVGSVHRYPIVAVALVLVLSREILKSKGVSKFLLLEGPIKESIEEFSGLSALQFVILEESFHLLLESHILTLAIHIPCTHTIHRLGATTSRALLHTMSVRARMAVVSSVGANLVIPAAPVLVVVSIVFARPIGIPCTHAVNRLSATTSRPLLIHVRKRAAVSIVGSRGGHLVVTVPLVLVTVGAVRA